MIKPVQSNIQKFHVTRVRVIWDLRDINVNSKKRKPNLMNGRKRKFNTEQNKTKWKR